MATVAPIADYLVKLFKDKEADMILVAYSHFDSLVSQRAVVQQFLPIIPFQKEDLPAGRQGKGEEGFIPARKTR